MGAAVGCFVANAMAAAHAAGAPDASQTLLAGKPAAKTHGIEEVVVTARKTRENLIKVPVAVSVLSQHQMKLRSIRGIDGLSDFTPGFHSTDQTVGRNDRGFNSYTIRGIVSGVTSTRPGVTIFMDGTPVAGGNISGITDVDHVEIIKGPQSAYFGRATFAGAINFITTPPSDRWHSSIDAEAGTYGTTDDTATVQGPIIPGILDMRASYHHYSTDGQYKDQLDPGVNLGARSTNSGSFELHATPTPTTTINAFVNDWTDDDGPSAQGVLNGNYSNCKPPGGDGAGFICGPIHGTPAGGFLYDTIGAFPSFVSLVGSDNNGLTNAVEPSLLNTIGLARRAYQAHINFIQELGDGYTLAGNVARDSNNWMEIQGPIGNNDLAIPNPFHATTPGSPTYNTTAVRVDSPDTDYSAEIRLSSPQTGRFKWTLGANYYEQSSGLSTTADSIVGLLTFTPYTLTTIRTTGVFGSASYDILRNLTFSVEGRGQWDDLSSHVEVGADNPEFKQTYPSFSPRFILSYKPVDDVMLYTSFSRGYRPGEFNPQYAAATPLQKQQIAQLIPSVAAAVPQEKLNMLEAGFKTQLLQNRLRFIADAYYGDWSNYHITEEIPTEYQNVISTVQVVQAGGRILLHGVEAEATYRVDDNLTLEAGFDWAASNIRHDYCATCVQINGIANNVGNTLPSYPT